MTAPDQVLAKGSWEADEKALKMTLDVFESFPLAPCAAPGTVITIEFPVFDWDKSVLTGRVKDFLLLRDYTHRADGKDREQLCKKEGDISRPLWLVKPEDTQD